MYGNNNVSQSLARGGSARDVGGGSDDARARALHAPTDLPTYKMVSDGRKAWPVDENGEPLGIITKSHPTLDTQGFQRIQDYALQQQSAKLLHGKSRVCFVVNVRLIKIEIDRLSIIQTLNGHILRMFKDAALSGIAKSALKDH